MTLEELAEGLDVSYQQVQRYESGKNVLSVDKLQLIAEFLDVPVDYFFKGGSESGSRKSVKGLSPEEARFLKLFRKMDGKYRACIRQVMNLAAKKK